MFVGLSSIYFPIERTAFWSITDNAILLALYLAPIFTGASRRSQTQETYETGWEPFQ